jgi:hypothetical protein
MALPFLHVSQDDDAAGMADGVTLPFAVTRAHVPGPPLESGPHVVLTPHVNEVHNQVCVPRVAGPRRGKLL